MKKTVICIVSTAAAFVLGNCVEHSEHDLGWHPVRLGLRFLPRLLRVSLCPARCREESCVRCCLGVLRRILGDCFNSRLLAVKGIISDTLAFVVVPPLTAFCGLSYIMSDYSVFYSVLIAFTLIAALNLILTARKTAAAKHKTTNIDPRSRPVSRPALFMPRAEKPNFLSKLLIKPLYICYT